MKIAVVVPFLDEEAYLPELLASLSRQTRLPDRLVLVDDGSTDGSARIAAAFAEGRPWVEVIRRAPRPPARDRMVRASELRSFQEALAHLDEDFDVVAKLDADLRLSPRTLAEIERRFAADPLLGLAGTYLSEVGHDGALRRHRCPPGNVEGATKFYRRECLSAISPIPAILGWDTIDEARTRMRGWRTQTFEVPGGDPVHLRRLWAGDGVLRGYRRAGRAAYAYGAHPAMLLLSVLVRLRDRPRILAAMNYLAGWGLAAGGRGPRAEPELRAFVRREQLKRIRRSLAPGHGQQTAPAAAPPRVCMVVHGQYPQDPRVARAARMAQDAGFRVDVVCHRSEGRPVRETVVGANVRRLPVSHRRGVGAATLVLEYLAFTALATATLAVRSLRSPYEVVHLNAPPDLLALAGLIPRLRGSGVVLDIHDRTPLMFQVRYGKAGPAERLTTWVERVACRFADAVITVHDPYREELASHGVDPRKVTIVMNTPEQRLIEGVRSRASATAGSDADEFRVVYHGTITHWYGLPVLMRAVALVAARVPGIQVEVLGEGDALEEARIAARDLEIDRVVTFSGRYLPLEEVLYRVARADCGVVPNLASPLNELTLSNKLLEYVALEVPVVAARLRTLAQHFGEDEVTFFDVGDEGALADALAWVAQHPADARAKAARARRRAEAYGWDRNRDRYTGLLESLRS